MGRKKGKRKRGGKGKMDKREGKAEVIMGREKGK